MYLPNTNRNIFLNDLVKFFEINNINYCFSEISNFTPYFRIYIYDFEFCLDILEVHGDKNYTAKIKWIKLSGSVYTIDETLENKKINEIINFIIKEIKSIISILKSELSKIEKPFNSIEEFESTKKEWELSEEYVIFKKVINSNTPKDFLCHYVLSNPEILKEYEISEMFLRKYESYKYEVGELEMLEKTLKTINFESFLNFAIRNPYVIKRKEIALFLGEENLKKIKEGET